MPSTNSAGPKRMLVTGATGTLGHNIIARLAEDEAYRIVAPVRNLHAQVVSEFGDRVQFVEHELSDSVLTGQLFERVDPDVVIHCAASGLRPPRQCWFESMRFNVESTMGLFQMSCRSSHDSQFIYISTGLVYREQQRPLCEDDPLEALHPYGASKGAADAMLQAAAAEFNRSLTIFRPFAFTGLHDGGGRLFPLILDAAVRGRTQELTAGTQIRDFCAVSDVADAVVLAIKGGQKSLIQKFNLGSGLGTPLRDLIGSVCDELELKAELHFGAVEMRPYEPPHSVANVSHAADKLGWRPRTRLAYAVWELAQSVAPSLQLKKPRRFCDD